MRSTKIWHNNEEQDAVVILGSDDDVDGWNLIQAHDGTLFSFVGCVNAGWYGGFDVTEMIEVQP